MSVALSIPDLFYIAVGIEKKGIAFYDVMARSSPQQDIREVFLYLTGMERRHVQIFQEAFHLLSKSQFLSDRDYPGYVQTLLDNSVFTDELADSEIVNNLTSDVGAIELGIQAEKDSILFYYEMLDQVDETIRDAIKRIITEEKSHLKQLSEMKKTYQGK
jgi:rubrerythrin